MGIDVNDKIVTFNASHEHRVVTDTARRCPTAQAGGVSVVSIFARKRTRQDSDDGNPLIYALKGKFGYTIPMGDLKEIYRRAALILPKALDGKNFDIVVPLPSSSSVASILGTRIVRTRANVGIADCLAKATIRDVLAGLPLPDEVPQRDRREYTSLLSTLQGLNPGSAIEMKRIPFKFRLYLTPVVAQPTAEACRGKSVLLVDDIFGTGSSLQSAAIALSAYEPLSVTAVTLMGRLS